MIRRTSILPLAAVALLAACNPATQAKVENVSASAVRAGALFCATSTAAGPLVVALANMAGAPVSVTGMASADVAAACRLIAAIPVAPPANATGVPVVAAPTTLPAVAG